MRRRAWAWVVAGCAILSQARTDGRQIVPCGGNVPSNVEIDRDLVSAFEEVFRQSGTFRAQCERISAASNLRVTVRLRPWLPPRCRAVTQFHRRGRAIRAEVDLPPARSGLPELLGHEFEHILEQLEGLSMRRLSRIRNSGVYEVERELFESVRAQKIGRTVADEVRRGAALD